MSFTQLSSAATLTISSIHLKMSSIVFRREASREAKMVLIPVLLVIGGILALEKRASRRHIASFQP
jgi:hypothetical protein